MSGSLAPAHYRIALRKRVAELIEAAGITCFSEAFAEIDEEQMPCAVVMIDSETSTNSTIGRNPIQSREANLVILLMAKAKAGATDLLDEMCAEIEVALLAAGALQGAAKSIALQQTTIDADEAGDGAAGIVRGVMIFGVTAMTNAGSPAVTR